MFKRRILTENNKSQSNDVQDIEPKFEVEKSSSLKNLALKKVTSAQKDNKDAQQKAVDLQFDRFKIFMNKALLKFSDEKPEFTIKNSRFFSHVEGITFSVGKEYKARERSMGYSTSTERFASLMFVRNWKGPDDKITGDRILSLLDLGYVLKNTSSEGQYDVFQSNYPTEKEYLHILVELGEIHLE